MKKAVQNIGRALSGMVMPNLGVFIAWGLLTALFAPSGWLPHEALGSMAGLMLTYLLPLLIGYTGGAAAEGGVRGGAVGAVAAMGVIMGADIPMLAGAMIAGPLGGACIKGFDRAVEGRVPQGFEMLVNTFSAGIIGAVLAIAGCLAIGPGASWASKLLGGGAAWLAERKLLPFTSFIVEPAKVLFLNNAINHGVLTPLGAQQAQETGRSLYYMIESNPGPGLGLLLAYRVAGKGSAKTSAAGAAVIQFLGGIHEIYFPYVLMNPVLMPAVAAGGFTGVMVLSILGGGLIAPASPASIFTDLMMTPRGAYLANFLGIGAAAGVSFCLSAVLLKLFGKAGADLGAAGARSGAVQAGAGGGADARGGAVRKIAFACDAGMGSSVMGAARLRKKLAGAGVSGIEVVHAPVGGVPADVDLIICHQELRERAQAANPQARLIGITDFLSAPEYDALIEELKH
jgi:PTS system mannitol-specific IIC component